MHKNAPLVLAAIPFSLAPLNNLFLSVIELPSVTGIGEFKAAMALYSDGSFLLPMPAFPTARG